MDALFWFLYKIMRVTSFHYPRGDNSPLKMRQFALTEPRVTVTHYRHAHLLDFQHSLGFPVRSQIVILRCVCNCLRRENYINMFYKHPCIVCHY